MIAYNERYVEPHERRKRKKVNRIVGVALLYRQRNRAGKHETATWLRLHSLAHVKQQWGLGSQLLVLH
jgi:hypothetical protein